MVASITPSPLFLSTPSARRATQCAMSYITTINISIHALREEGDGAAPHGKQSGRNFYPRPPRGGRRPDRHPGCHDHCISIHALREEGDHIVQSKILPRLPISIHALREEGDLYHRHGILIAIYFYPRPPRGGRQLTVTACILALEFLSTPSARRATLNGGKHNAFTVISIHALREEGDV